MQVLDRRTGGSPAQGRRWGAPAAPKQVGSPSLPHWAYRQQVWA